MPTELLDPKIARTVTMKAIEENILSVSYTDGAELYQPNKNDPLALNAERMSLHTFTICVVVLKNGYQLVGSSGCADPRKFDKVLGQKLAYEKCIDQIWPLMGYELKQKLYEENDNV